MRSFLFGSAVALLLCGSAYAQTGTPTQFAITAPAHGITQVPVDFSYIPVYDGSESTQLSQYIAGDCAPAGPGKKNPGVNKQYPDGCEIGLWPSPTVFYQTATSSTSYAAIAFSGYTSDNVQQYECTYETIMTWTPVSPSNSYNGTCSLSIAATTTYIGGQIAGHSVSCLGNSPNQVQRYLASGGEGCNGLTIGATPVTSP